MFIIVGGYKQSGFGKELGKYALVSSVSEFQLVLLYHWLLTSSSLCLVGVHSSQVRHHSCRFLNGWLLLNTRCIIHINKIVKLKSADYPFELHCVCISSRYSKHYPQASISTVHFLIMLNAQKTCSFSQKMNGTHGHKKRQLGDTGTEG